ncbi:hypothetical protein ACQCX5_02360 [Propionibacteriaceae bacterium G57]|uniref:hypothetical protein n=1 Tax=Aestuariimicrobium sp. G57 TaxID=3418485 RepID=UPI003DA72562
MALQALVLVALGVSVMAQGHGRFSVGVGAALLVYGVAVAGIAWLGWKKHPLAFGPMMGANVLHAMVIASTANGSKALWLWFGLIPVVASIVALLWPSTRAEFGRGPQPK